MATSAAALRSHISSTLGLRWDPAFGVDRRPVQESLPTGIQSIDELTGGLPRGGLTEIFGATSTGRTTVMLSLLAQATSREEFCAVIDTTGAFDPESAQRAGVRLPQILWIRCGGNAEHALKAADLLVQAGGFGLIVMDLADTSPQQARRISLASWFRLRHAVEKTATALVAIAQNVNAASCSTLQLNLRQTQVLWSGKLLKGLRAEADSRKHYRVRSAAFTAHR